ncbi:MAG: hypothetical protein ACJAVI_000079 [Candidatus Azotimanducaceae bacterium]|jgi:hypothetical protein
MAPGMNSHAGTFLVRKISLMAVAAAQNSRIIDSPRIESESIGEGVFSLIASIVSFSFWLYKLCKQINEL